jgi:uncharacterized protein YceK
MKKVILFLLIAAALSSCGTAKPRTDGRVKTTNADYKKVYVSKERRKEVNKTVNHYHVRTSILPAGQRILEGWLF